MGRDEYGQRGGIYDYWACYEDHQSGRDENRARMETLSSLFSVCYSVFLDYRYGRKPDLIIRRESKKYRNSPPLLTNSIQVLGAGRARAMEDTANEAIKYRIVTLMNVL